MAGANAGNHGSDGKAGQKNSENECLSGKGLRLTGVAGIGEETEKDETGEEEQEDSPEADGGSHAAEQGRHCGRGGRCGGGSGVWPGITHSMRVRKNGLARSGDRIRVVMRRIYFDNNATTPLLPEVYEAMQPFLLESFGNASSIHQQGQQARAAVEQAREQVAELLGARPSEIVFTSGGTEGDNLALFGLVEAGDHVISSTIEHHAVLNSCKRLEADGRCCDLRCLRCERGGAARGCACGSAAGDEADFRDDGEQRDRSAATGGGDRQRLRARRTCTSTPMRCRRRGRLPIDVERIGCDLLTIAAHKMHGPQGVGALFVRRATLLRSMQIGGRHERGRRAGTENLAGIVGMGKAAELAMEWLANGGHRAA